MEQSSINSIDKKAIKLFNTDFCVPFYFPHRFRMSLHGEDFSLSIALASERLQCYSKLHTKVCVVQIQFIEGRSTESFQNRTPYPCTGQKYRVPQTEFT